MYDGKEDEKFTLPKFYNEQGENCFVNLLFMFIK